MLEEGGEGEGGDADAFGQRGGEGVGFPGPVVIFTYVHLSK